MKKVMFLLLAVALLLVMAVGCSSDSEDLGTGTPDAAEDTTDVEPAPIADDDDDESEEEAPPADSGAQEYHFGRVTWFFNEGGIQIPADNYFSQRVLEEINVEFVPINPETADYEGVLFSFLAAGEQLDLIMTWAELERQLVMDDIIQPVGHWLNETYLPNLIRVSRIWDETLMTSLEHADGYIYAIPSVWNNVRPEQLDWIRTDWLEYVGMEVPTTFDELTEVLRAFAAGNPNQDDLNFFPNMVNELWGLQGVFAAYAADNNWYMAEDGYLELGFLSPRVIEVLELINAWFEEGLINQDFMTTIYADITERIQAGLVGYHRGWSGLNHTEEIRGIYPDSDWAPILPLHSPYFSRGYESYERRTSHTRNRYVMSVNVRDPEPIFRLINFMNDDTATSTEPGQMTFEGGYWHQFGERGVHWDIMNGLFVGPGGPGTWEDPEMQAAAERFETVHETDRWAGWAVRRFLNVFDTRWMGVDPLGQAMVLWERENIIDAGLMRDDIPETERYRAWASLVPQDDEITNFINYIGNFGSSEPFAEIIAFHAIMGMDDANDLYERWLEFANANGYQEIRRLVTEHIMANPF